MDIPVILTLGEMVAKRSGTKGNLQLLVQFEANLEYINIAAKKNPFLNILLILGEFHTMYFNHTPLLPD